MPSGFIRVIRVNPRRGVSVFLWALQDLNLGPMDYESTALTAELRARTVAHPFYIPATPSRPTAGATQLTIDINL